MIKLTNITKIPNCLNKSDFYNWFFKFNSLIQTAFLLREFDSGNDINITFSEKKECRKFGLYFTDEIIDYIEGHYIIDDDIKKQLKKCANDKQSLNNNLEIIASKIKELNPESADNVYLQLKDLLDNVAIEKDVLGIYDHRNKEIVLYVLNIENHSKKNKLMIEEVYEETFIHELFHAYHYKDNDNELKLRCDYTSKVVKESLASYFQYIYILNNNISKRSLLENSWKKHNVCSYPYSGARFIKDKQQFTYLFIQSKRDLDKTLRDLLFDDIDTFYKIKNKVDKEIIKVTRENTKSVNNSSDFRQLLETLKVGVIANTYLRAILDTGKVSPSEINKFKTEYGKTSTFGLSFPLLSKIRKVNNRNRYYKIKIKSYGGEYYLTNHWGSKHKRALIDWIIQWINDNGMSI